MSEVSIFKWLPLPFKYSVKGSICANVKHFFHKYSKQFFTLHGKEIFQLLHGF